MPAGAALRSYSPDCALPALPAVPQRTVALSTRLGAEGRLGMPGSLQRRCVHWRDQRSQQVQAAWEAGKSLGASRPGPWQVPAQSRRWAVRPGSQEAAGHGARMKHDALLRGWGCACLRRAKIVECRHGQHLGARGVQRRETTGPGEDAAAGPEGGGAPVQLGLAGTCGPGPTQPRGCARCGWGHG